MADYIIDGPGLGGQDKCPTFLFAHGAGAPMDSGFMNEMAAKISAFGIRVVRFEFPYMAARRITGKKAPPPKAEKLMPEFEAHIAHVGEQIKGPLIIAGKSMGGRIASMVADECFENKRVNGLVCFGYPFHAIGKPEKLRTVHLVELQTPFLICQGERDAFGTRDEVEALTLSPKINFSWAGDGNHDLRPRKVSGLTHAQNLQDAARASAEFVLNL